MRAALDFALHDARAFEHLDVLGRGGERDLERFGQLAHAAGLAGKTAHHRASRRVGEGAEYGVETIGV